MRAAPALVCALVLGACGSSDDYTVVTVRGRAGVHDVAKLAITLTNAGTTRTDELPLDGKALPVTFALTAPGRDGDLAISISALDAAGTVVGQGAAATTVATPTADVLLDTADFVINTEYAGDQYPSDDYEAHGFQVAAMPDGTWTAVFRDTCATPCHMFGRRFDAEGRPLVTAIAASTNQFAISTDLTNSLSTPAVAATASTTMAVWDSRDPAGTTSGIACRTIDGTGMGLPSQKEISADSSTDVVSIAALSTGNFAVVWNAFLSSSVIRSAIVKPDCTVLGTIVTDNVGTISARRAAVAASGTPSNVMTLWVVDGGVRFRVSSATNATLVADTLFVAKPAAGNELVESVRVAPSGTGFAVAVRWAATLSTGTGRIDLYRTNATGMILGAPVTITDKAGADFESSEGFGIATRADGVTLVAWHACAENGDGDDCGVFGRAVKADGTFVGDAFVIPTTTKAAQTNPSVTALTDAFVVVWKDLSAVEPDHAGAAARARIVYPGASTTPPGS